MPPNFRAWVRAQYNDIELQEIAEFGGDGGWRGASDYKDTTFLYATYGQELHRVLGWYYEDAQLPLPLLASIGTQEDFQHDVVVFALDVAAKDLIGMFHDPEFPTHSFWS